MPPRAGTKMLPRGSDLLHCFNRYAQQAKKEYGAKYAAVGKTTQSASVCCVCGHHFRQTRHQPGGMVANPAMVS